VARIPYCAGKGVSFDQLEHMLKNAELYRLLLDINRSLQKQTEIQQTNIDALESLTKTMIQTVSSVKTLNAELKTDDETIGSSGSDPSGGVH
jgi:hypothetical protein